MSRPLYTTDIKSISDLTEVTTLGDSANLLIQSGTNFYKLTGARLASYYINGTDYRILLTGNDLGIRANSVSFSANSFNFGGFSGKATGFGAIHIGWGGLASGAFSTHMGLSGTASGFNAFHMGANGTASGFASFHAGWKGLASGLASTHLSQGGQVYGARSVHTGLTGFINVSATESFHSGQNGKLSSFCTAHFGQLGIVSGDRATHFGIGGKSEGVDSMHIGRFGNAAGYTSFHTGEFGELTGLYTSHFGMSGSAIRYGEKVHSVGSFAKRGDAQHSEFIAKNITTDNVETELLLGGPFTANRMTLSGDTTWFFEAKVAARRTDADDESAAYEIKGCIDNNAGTVALVGVPTVTVVAEDTTSWTVSATADNSNKALKLTATGENSKVIRWVALVDVVQVSG